MTNTFFIALALATLGLQVVEAEKLIQYYNELAQIEG